jgi:hydroxyacylglutathione hydrolase
MELPLEDLYGDIIGKAQRGLKFQDGVLTEVGGITQEELEQAKRGEFNEGVARRLALVLGLDADALCESGKKSWHPAPVEIKGLEQFTTTWDDMTVNSWIVWDEKSRSAVAIDTGADASPMLEFLKSNDLRLDLILLTHAHPDHVAALTDLRSVMPSIPVYLHQDEQYEGGKTEPVTDGDVFQVGELTLEVRFTPGHSPGGTTYVVSGLSRPVAIVGDALFSGSMGGAPTAWRAALRVNQQKILSLPESTILCPGHGPMTTVGEELQHNPFYASGARS